MPISSPKSPSTVSASTPPHPNFAHGDAPLAIHSEPQSNNLRLCPTLASSGNVWTNWVISTLRAGGQPEELPNRPFSTRSVLFHLFLQVIIRHRQLLCSPGARSRAPDWATAYDANLAILRALRRERAATLAIVEFELVWAPHLLSRWTTRTASGTAR